ncbi:acyl-CoA synthetase (AMP-forming)/AMP-acid ligase II [Kordia periserrulae]|uniref:Acyl-CoA synthetase (AMP-forming)/AMP-acid ligase II n=1 Tax=Kordia periserrulae TaxID=701523 RepID=A0A2T6BSE9_9FLAO|nr:class I adenylate-forming enzyme family protein [Kordia periserrulae]PTX58979.1 acyl-CoA synthetase (AMP-forming)/AMP-acid ligase II [Kordia periserrulae]
MQLETLLQNRNPNTVYIQTEKAAYTYSELSVFATAFQHAFLKDSKEIIALKIQDQALLAFCIWACIQQEQSFVLLPFQTTPTLEKTLLSKASCDLVITSNENHTEELSVAHLTSYRIKVQSEKTTNEHIPKVGFMSSGTTGTPKLIWNTFAQLETSLACIYKENLMPYCQQQQVLISPFLTHSYGFSAFLEYTMGNSTIFLPSEASFAGLFRLLAKKEIQSQITAIEGVPYFYKQLLVLQKKIHFSSLQHIGFGGDFVHDVLLQSLHKIYPNASFSVRYGISEIPSVIALNTFTTPTENSNSYQILPCYSVMIDEEIVVHSQDSQASIYTGDIGRINHNRLFIEGRKASFLKVKGYKVSPNFVENALISSEMVTEVNVFIKNDALVAEVIPLPNFDKMRLKIYLTNKLPSYAIPDVIKEVETMERTHTGKIRRQ